MGVLVVACYSGKMNISFIVFMILYVVDICYLIIVKTDITSPQMGICNDYLVNLTKTIV